MELRIYQKQAIDRILATDDHVIRQNFTGTGKSVEIFSIANYYLDNGKTVFIVVPKEYLLTSLSKLFVTKSKHKPNYVKANWKTDWNYKLYICSIQTLYKRLDQLGVKPDIVLFDECHCLKANTYKKVVSFFQAHNARTIGWSATPVRLDGQGFNDFFSELVTTFDYRWYIDNHFLSDYKIPNINQFTKQFSIKQGEFDLKEQEEFYNNPTILIDAVESWQKYCPGEKTVVFCTSLEHSRTVASQYNQLGHELYGRDIAVHLDATTKPAERDLIFKKLESGELLILCNFNLITEGLDIPSVSVTQWLRVTKSEVIFDQGNGRSNRYVPGKTQIILDHVGNLAIHGLPCRFRAYDLKGRKQLDQEERTRLKCVSCGLLLLENINKVDRTFNQLFSCPDCGTENYLLAKKKKESWVETRDTSKYKEDFQDCEGFLEIDNYRDINLRSLVAKYGNLSVNAFWHKIKHIETLTLQDYIKLAKLKGLKESDGISGYTKRLRK
jgi:superfamily II DNA or RNA helicase